MKYDPTKHHRRSTRLKGLDYSSPGAYFITICTHHRECLLGEVVNNELCLNRLGQVVSHSWQRLPLHFSNLVLDEFVVMPNHVHGILILIDLLAEGKAFDIETASSNQELPPNASPLQVHGTRCGSIGSIVQTFKSGTTRRLNKLRQTSQYLVWQRNYYDHLIHDDSAFQRIREYIRCNSLTWEQDQLHPNNPSQ